MTTETTKSTYEIRVWEKAEHWYFDATVEATCEAGAWIEANKAYPKRSYTVRSVRKVW